MWKYTGDRNIEYGGMFYFEDGPDLSPDYMQVVRVTPASDGGGMDNRYLIEVGSCYMPNDDIARMNSAANVVGCTIRDDKSMDDNGVATYEFQSPEWRLRMLDAWMAYWGQDGAVTDSYVVQVGREKPDPNKRFEFLDNVEPDYVLRSNVNLRRWIENNFCN